MPMSRRTFIMSSAAALAAAAAPSGSRAAASKKTRLLVLGGTKFLGPAIVEVALARGHEVTLFNRGKTRPGLFPGVEELRGDRDGQMDALRGRTWDTVIDTSGYLPRLVRMSAELLAPSVGRYLFVSSISVYREGVKARADESAPLRAPPDPKTEDVGRYYGSLKVACERAAEAALPARVAVVRPGLIVGPEDPTDRFTYWPVRLEKGGEVLAPGDGSDPVQVIDVRDLGAWMVGLAERGVTGTYNAVGPAERLTWKPMLEAMKAAVGSKASLVWLPASSLAEKKVEPWSDLPAFVPAAESGLAALSNARAVAQGLRFRPLPETARDTLAWWKAQPDARRTKLGAGLSAEREREVLAAWKAR